MSKNDNKIADILSITPMEIQKVDKKELDDSTVEELKNILQTQKDMVSLGVDSMEELIMIAKSTESPRAFEIVADFIRTISTANKDMLSIMETQKKMVEGDQGGPQVINNNLYVGKASDLFQKIKENVDNGSD